MAKTLRYIVSTNNPRMLWI